MTETKTIKLPKTMSLVDRIEGVSKEIRKWLDSLDEPYNAEQDVMHLTKCERNDKFRYVYTLERAVRDPAEFGDGGKEENAA